MATVKLRTERVRLNADGYDSRGRYYGSGAPVYRVTDDDGNIDEVVRARSSAEARKTVAVAKGIRTLTAKEQGRHPLYDVTEKLRKSIRKEKRTLKGNKATLRKLYDLRDRLKLLAHPNDIAWRYLNEDLSNADRKIYEATYEWEADNARYYLSRAAEDLSGLASRVPPDAVLQPARDARRRATNYPRSTPKKSRAR